FNKPTMVINPTPPGTGVIQDDFLDTSSKSTSPYSLKPDFVSVESSRLIPTSIKTAPSFTISAVTKCLRPMAATTMSPASTSSFKPRSEEHTSELQSRENLVC